MKITGSKSAGNTLTLFIILWGILSLWQAANSGLIHDEAYYRMYGLNPDVGFFDHPPMTGWMMIPGLKLFTGALSVRFSFVITGFLTILGLFFIIKPSGKEQVKLLIMLLMTIPIIHVGSFLAVPDVPMVFFSVLFFIFLKQYLYNDNLRNALLLTLTIAGMLYSKYHGILLVFFTLIAFPGFFKRKSFYLTLVVSILLFLPHIIWQYQHDFITLGYHLSGRVKTWSPIFIGDYVGGQLFIFGGLATIPMLLAAILPKTKNPFSRILKVNIIGILAFFFVASFRMHIEANWTVCLAVPIVYLAFHGFENSVKLRKWLKIMAVPTILAIVIARIFLVYDFIPEKYRQKNEIHGWESWSEQITKLAGDKPVVFMNSYQKASRYAFHTDRFSHTFNSVRYRKNQYDLWDTEERAQGEKVFFMPNKDVFYLPYIEKAKIDSFKSSWGEYFYFAVVEDFKTYNKVKINLRKPSPGKDTSPGGSDEAYHHNKTLSPGKTINLDLSLTNPYPYEVYISQKGEQPVWLVATIFNHNMKDGYEEYIHTQDLLISTDEETQISIPLTTPGEPGIYYISFGLATDWMPPGYNSKFYKIIVE